VSVYLVLRYTTGKILLKIDNTEGGVRFQTVGEFFFLYKHPDRRNPVVLRAHFSDVERPRHETDGSSLTVEVQNVWYGALLSFFLSTTCERLR